MTDRAELVRHLEVARAEMHKLSWRLSQLRYQDDGQLDPDELEEFTLCLAKYEGDRDEAERALREWDEWEAHNDVIVERAVAEHPNETTGELLARLDRMERDELVAEHGRLTEKMFTGGLLPDEQAQLERIRGKLDAQTQLAVDLANIDEVAASARQLFRVPGEQAEATDQPDGWRKDVPCPSKYPRIDAVDGESEICSLQWESHAYYDDTGGEYSPEEIVGCFEGWRPAGEKSEPTPLREELDALHQSVWRLWVDVQSLSKREGAEQPECWHTRDVPLPPNEWVLICWREPIAEDAFEQRYLVADTGRLIGKPYTHWRRLEGPK